MTDGNERTALGRFLRRFKRKPKPQPILPAAGETWRLYIDDGSPWPVRGVTASILDVKDGWVRYSMGGWFNDERLKLSEFLHCYRKVD